ncbi:MAG: hypothetical protein SOR83_01990, partial [Butyricicoccus pullicaecorum]|uniref:hypothetical protein n=1 Tax=Eisenbergiella massiliensis TaxID=1720294 RepID=UPI0023F2EB0C
FSSGFADQSVSLFIIPQPEACVNNFFPLFDPLFKKFQIVVTLLSLWTPSLGDSLYRIPLPD